MNGMKLCKYCRSEIDKKAKVCPYCQRKQGGGCMTIVGGVCVLIFGSFLLSMCSSPSSSNNNTSNINNDTSIEDTTFETKKQYKDSCKTVTYEELARDKDMMQGERLCLTGQIVQADGKRFRMEITKKSYGYDDAIMFDFNTDKIDYNVLEKDIVTIWGESQGSYTYKAVLGNEITVPRIKAEYLERVTEE